MVYRKLGSIMTGHPIRKVRIFVVLMTSVIIIVGHYQISFDIRFVI